MLKISRYVFSVLFSFLHPEQKYADVYSDYVTCLSVLKTGPSVHVI